MNIGIAANVLIFEKAGIGKYSQNLLKNLFKIDKTNHYYLYFSYLRHRRERQKQIRQLLGKIPSNVSLRFLPLPAAWVEFLFSTPLSAKTLFRDQLDLYYSPYVAGIPKNGWPKMVFTCHDLVFIRFPEHRGERLSNYYLKRHQIALKNCQKIIVPSKATKKDLEKFLQVNPKKIIVIAEAAEEKFKKIINRKKIEQVISRYFNPKSKYILSVGTLEPRKNLPKLVEAYSKLPHLILGQYRLVLVGGQGWNNKFLQKTINNLNLKDKVIFPGFVKDEDLPYIYNGASVFVYPSLWEGFGLPPLEAASCGVPVVASNLSSLGEVIGKAGMLVNPNDEKAIAEAIKKIIISPKLAQKLRLKGLAQAKKFSWAKAAKETLQVFKEVSSRRVFES